MYPAAAPRLHRRDTLRAQPIESATGRTTPARYSVNNVIFISSLFSASTLTFFHLITVLSINSTLDVAIFVIYLLRYLPMYANLFTTN